MNNLIAIFSLWCVVNVNSQTTTTTRMTTITPNMNSVAARIQQFNMDIQSIYSPGGKLDSQKLLADIQAIVNAARMSSINLPPKVQIKLSNLSNDVDQMTGKASPNQIMQAISGAKEEIVQEINLARGPTYASG